MSKPVYPSEERLLSTQRACKRRRGCREEAKVVPGESLIGEIDVGRCLRGLRCQRGLSMRALAEQSGLNVNTLSLIENGKSSPSVATLQVLASTLEMPITAFFDPGISRKEIAYHRACERRRAAFAYGTLEDLGAGMINCAVAPFLVVLDPQATSGPAQIVHTGREFVFCLEGRLTYLINDQEFLLEPGDSLLFEAHLPHRWFNAGVLQTRSILVLCPSDEHDRSTELHFISSSAHPARS